MVSMTGDVEYHIRNSTPWPKLPPSVKSSLGNAPGLYDKTISEFSVKNQLRWRGSMVRHVIKDERKYYEKLLQYSQEHLMLYPYHLQDMLIKGLRITPFVYYSQMMATIMQGEKSYDSLPNFTAADCLRLMGIGRNQYIDLMNQYRSKKFFRRRGIRDLLPVRPVSITRVEPWWIVHCGFITEDDIKVCSEKEHKTVDRIIDVGAMEVGILPKDVILNLYNRGLVYFDIYIEDYDHIVVPPLQGFVMNRVQGDYFETLLYKIFVSIDEHTSIGDLAAVLQVDLNQVKHAVSVFIRLAFAFKKNSVTVGKVHPSWSEPSPSSTPVKTSPPGPSPLTLGITDAAAESEQSSKPVSSSPAAEESTVSMGSSVTSSITGVYQKRLAFLFDSTLTAFLMMGNLSPGLKNHAVTMFEVGKLAEETMDSFVTELGKVVEQAEGEARRYYEHTIALRNTIMFLRSRLPSEKGASNWECGHGLDLLRLESMASLDPATVRRLLQKNYSVLISMAPLSQEVQFVSSCSPPHLGPAVAEMNSTWFKLWLYSKLECGPVSLLLAKGNRLRKLPHFIKKYSRVLVTTWGHDPTIVYVSNLLLTVNDALTHSAVLIQAHGVTEDGEEQSITFPIDSNEEVHGDLHCHPCLKQLEGVIELSHTCGYITFLKTGEKLDPQSSNETNQRKKVASKKKKTDQKISEFLQEIQALGIGDSVPAPSPLQPTTTAAAQNGTNPATATSSAQADGREVVKEDASAALTPKEKSLMAEWVPLGLNFGIPLFSLDSNSSVCNKIVQFNLMSQESLDKQTRANRLLALDLLHFISRHQDIPYFQESLDSSSHFSDATSSVTVPMPTRNLLFMNGVITNFDS